MKQLKKKKKSTDGWEGSPVAKPDSSNSCKQPGVIKTRETKLMPTHPLGFPVAGDKSPPLPSWKEATVTETLGAALIG